jgi:hypothetical protein
MRTITALQWQFSNGRQDTPWGLQPAYLMSAASLW